MGPATCLHVCEAMVYVLRSEPLPPRPRGSSERPTVSERSVPLAPCPLRNFWTHLHTGTFLLPNRNEQHAGGDEQDE